MEGSTTRSAAATKSPGFCVGSEGGWDDPECWRRTSSTPEASREVDDDGNGDASAAAWPGSPEVLLLDAGGSSGRGDWVGRTGKDGKEGKRGDVRDINDDGCVRVDGDVVRFDCTDVRDDDDDVRANDDVRVDGDDVIHDGDDLSEIMVMMSELMMMMS